MKTNLFLLFLFIPVLTFGQFKLEDITLVKSFQNKIDKAEPSILSFTKPNDKPSSFLINAALGFDVANILFDRNEKLIKIYPFIEYNRNTLIDKIQHQLQTGLSIEWARNEEDRFIPVFLHDIKYVNDYQKNIESIQTSSLFSPKFTGINTDFKNFYIPDNLVTLGAKQFLAFEYIPYFGIESENRTKVESDSLKGNIYRFVAKVQSNIYLFPHRENNSLKYYLLVFSANYDYRNEFTNTSLKPLENNIFLQLSANYNLFKNDYLDARLGIDYINGANPTKAFENQNYYVLSFKLKL